MAEPVAISLLARFTGVYLEDSSIVMLPTELASVWRGNGGNEKASKSAVKVEVGLEMLQGRLPGPLLEAGRVTDRGSALQQAPLPKGALRVTDLGYWSLNQREQLSSAEVFWLLRGNPQVHFTDATGQPWDIADFAKAERADQVDIPIKLGARKGLPARLLGQRVPQAVADERRRKLRAQAKREGKTPSQRLLALADCSFFVTNVPSERLSIEEAFVIARLRWQIELLFKLWKSRGHLDKSVSDKPWRILCEFYAKLLAMIFQYWFFLTCAWAFPDRSLVKAAKTVRQHVFTLLLSLASPVALDVMLANLQRALLHGCRINKGRKTLRTFQLLLQFGEALA